MSNPTVDAYRWAAYALGCLTGAAPDLHWQWDEAVIAPRPRPHPSVPAGTPVNPTPEGIAAIEAAVQAVHAACLAAPGDTPLRVTMRCPLWGGDPGVVLTFSTTMRVDLAITAIRPYTGRWVLWPSEPVATRPAPPADGDFWLSGIPF